MGNFAVKDNFLLFSLALDHDACVFDCWSLVSEGVVSSSLFRRNHNDFEFESFVELVGCLRRVSIKPGEKDRRAWSGVEPLNQVFFFWFFV